MKTIVLVLGLFGVMTSLAPWAAYGEEIILAGFPAATSRCKLESALDVFQKEDVTNNQGQQAMPIAGNTFIVVDFALQFKTASSTISSKDFYLDSGKARFECVGFMMKIGTEKPPVFVGGADEATLSIGGKGNYAATKGHASLTLVFTGPRDYAKGTLKVMSNYPVQTKAKVKETPTASSKDAKKNKK
jgi:hypothetical protein